MVDRAANGKSPIKVPRAATLPAPLMGDESLEDERLSTRRHTMRTLLAGCAWALVWAMGASGGLRAQALHLTSPCPAGVTMIGSCPNEGCGRLSDALLNVAKNHSDVPAAPEDVHVHELVDLDEPTDWLTGQERDSVPGDEGREIRMTAFLKTVKTETSGESCNCNQHSPANTDLHVVMDDHKNDQEADSVTAEITPRVRAQSHPTWNAMKIGSRTGKFVRITGWLMLDTGHVHHLHKANNDPADHAGTPLVRATNWEVHPVTKFEICTSTVEKCKAGTGWKDVP
jgi:hypothetical protein